MKVRLKNEIAEALGFKPKKKKDNEGNPKYYLNKEKQEELKHYKLSKQIENLSVTGTSTCKNKDGEIVLEWVKKNVTQEDRLIALRTAIDTLKEDIAPTSKTKYKSKQSNNKLCNQYTLTDYHLGMMSWAEESGDDWDLKIAEDTLVKFFEVAMEKSPDAENCIFAQIGDFLHWDGLDAVTPASKHVLDADTRFTKLVRVAIRVIRRVIKMLLNKYKKVTVIMAEGNHDPASSVWLREMLDSFYDDEPRLFIDTNPDPYYCVTFGKVVLFFHHAHKKRIRQLDNVFVGKFKREFGNSDFAYGHTGHLHHEVKIESNLMTIEQHRTLAAKDAYASRGGYLSGRDSKVITYHKDYGEVGRSTININMLK